jgi:SAM-dependent methyltransferase
MLKRLALRVRSAWLQWWRGLPYRGSGRYCPLCRRPSRGFAPAGVTRRPARCIFCGSLERHRFLWRYLEDRTDLLSPHPSRRRVLHFAPEPCLARRLAALPTLDYVTADLEPGQARVQIDITAIPDPDASFDVILCSHVLEHVPDDRQALCELARVLKPTGWALLIVPLAAGPTVEDAAVTDPQERLRRFGQEDHVRIYGSDFPSRLEAAGFAVTAVVPGDVLTAAEMPVLGIPAGCEPIYRVTKK